MKRKKHNIMELRKIPTSDINLSIKLLVGIYEEMADEAYPWELTTIGDEIMRLEISKNETVQEGTLEMMRTLDQSLLMIGNECTLGKSTLTYIPEWGVALMHTIICQISELQEQIKYDNELLDNQ